MWKRSHKEIAFLITYDVVIHPQVLTFFRVLNTKSLSILIVNTIFHVTVLLLIYFYHQLVPALKKTLRQLII